MPAEDPALPGQPASSTRKWVAAAAALLLVAGGITGVLKLRDGETANVAKVAVPDSADDEESEVMQLQPANDLGPDSFSDTPLASENPEAASPEQLTTVSEVIEPGVRANQVRVVTGGAVGLYGGTTDEKACDKQQLIDFLRSDRGKAKAWVAALNADPKLKWPGGRLTVAKIPDYINLELMPALVLRDTEVVNHGFRSNGVPTTFNSTLEAGTKALVDKYGVFRVRCLCGNPLIGPRLDPKKRVKLIGKRWPEKPTRNLPTPSPASTATPDPSTSQTPSGPTVIRIRDAAEPLASLPLVQPDGTVVNIRTGSDGLLADAVDKVPGPTPTETADATPTDQPTAAADQACAASFCVPLRTGWAVESSSAKQLRLIDGKGEVYTLQESDQTDPAAALDQEKARLEGQSPPCTYVGSRDSVSTGPYTVLRDKWDRTTCDVVNTVALVSPKTGNVILGASANDGQLREVLFAEMTFP